MLDTSRVHLLYSSPYWQLTPGKEVCGDEKLVYVLLGPGTRRGAEYVRLPDEVLSERQLSRQSLLAAFPAETLSRSLGLL
jgi:hypothetical protein